MLRTTCHTGRRRRVIFPGLLKVGAACLLLSSCGGGGGGGGEETAVAEWLSAGTAIRADFRELGLVVKDGVRVDNPAYDRDVPGGIIINVESATRGYLRAGASYLPCSLEYRRNDLNFSLKALADDGSMGVVFEPGYLSSVTSPTAAAAWRYVSNVSGVEVVAAGPSASLEKQPQ